MNFFCQLTISHFSTGTLEQWNKSAGFLVFFEIYQQVQINWFFILILFFRFRFIFSTDLTKDVSYIFFVLKKKFQGKSSSVPVFQCSSVPVFSDRQPVKIKKDYLWWLMSFFHWNTGTLEQRCGFRRQKSFFKKGGGGDRRVSGGIFFVA